MDNSYLLPLRISLILSRLEQDSRYTQKISRSESNASTADSLPPATPHPTSLTTPTEQQQQQEVGVATTNEVAVVSPVNDDSTEEELLT